MPPFGSLDEATEQIATRPGLCVRWSPAPEADLPEVSSRDDPTGTALPGLPASSLDVEPWWGSRPLRLWVARRLYDHSDLPAATSRRVRPWLLLGTESGRGPDNEPLVTDVEAEGQDGRWGPLQRGRHRV